MSSYLAFTVARTRFAVPLERANKVVPLVALNAMPKADDCVAGLMNAGGVSVPVVDLAIRLDLSNRPPYSLAASIAICTRGAQWFGLLAHRIDGVVDIGDEKVELSDLMATENTPFLGVFRAEGGEQTLVLDLDRVLDLNCEIDPVIDVEAALS